MQRVQIHENEHARKSPRLHEETFAARGVAGGNFEARMFADSADAGDFREAAGKRGLIWDENVKIIDCMKLKIPFALMILSAVFVSGCSAVEPVKHYGNAPLESNGQMIASCSFRNSKLFDSWPDPRTKTFEVIDSIYNTK